MMKKRHQSSVRSLSLVCGVTMIITPASPLSERLPSRRRAIATTISTAAGSVLGGVDPAGAANNALKTKDVVKVVDGIRYKKLGGSGILVSELGLGTQRWGSTDFNAPDEQLCHRFLDRAVLGSGVNVIDTAEQYPIPSNFKNPEGSTEEIIGRWVAKGPGRRQKLVIASKITGGRHVTPRAIREDCEASLKRLGTDCT